MGRDHLVARIASIIALGMALWMLKDVFLPGVGPSMMAPGGTHGRMQKAMERGGLAGMLVAGVLVGICTVPCSGAMYLQIGVLHASVADHWFAPSQVATSRSSCRCSSCCSR
jgi:cytochrome c biogenesis protein CcdA